MHLYQNAVFWVHGGFPELLGVHFAKTLKPLLGSVARLLKSLLRFVNLGAGFSSLFYLLGEFVFEGYLIIEIVDFVA